MTVWRNKLKSGRTDEEGGAVNPDEAKAHCRRQRVVGVGWGAPQLGTDITPAELAAHWERQGWGKQPGRMIQTLADAVQAGDFMWTRGSTAYWLGRVDGPFQRDLSDEADRYDLYNVRPCNWLNRPLPDYEAPGAVVRSFTGRGATLRRIGNSPAAVRGTEMIWQQDVEHMTPEPFSPREVLTDLLDPIDVEDVVLIYLQCQGWILLPSTRRPDTPNYEAALKHRDDGRLAVVSVKSGSSAAVSIPELREAAGQGEAFAYSTHGVYSEPPEEHGVARIESKALIDFMSTRPDLLTPRIARWIGRS